MQRNVLGRFVAMFSFGRGASYLSDEERENGGDRNARIAVYEKEDPLHC